MGFAPVTVTFWRAPQCYAATGQGVGLLIPTLRETAFS
jgi:hypothetical protein